MINNNNNNRRGDGWVTRVTRVTRVDGTERGEGRERGEELRRRRRRKFVRDGSDGRTGSKALQEVLAELKGKNNLYLSLGGITFHLKLSGWVCLLLNWKPGYFSRSELPAEETDVGSSISSGGRPASAGHPTLPGIEQYCPTFQSISRQYFLCGWAIPLYSAFATVRCLFYRAVGFSFFNSVRFEAKLKPAGKYSWVRAFEEITKNEVET